MAIFAEINENATSALSVTGRIWAVYYYNITYAVLFSNSTASMILPRWIFLVNFHLRYGVIFVFC